MNFVPFRFPSDSTEFANGRLDMFNANLILLVAIHTLFLSRESWLLPGKRNFPPYSSTPVCQTSKPYLVPDLAIMSTSVFSITLIMQKVNTYKEKYVRLEEYDRGFTGIALHL